MLRAGDRARDIVALLELAENWTRRMIADGEDSAHAKSALAAIMGGMESMRELANAKENAELAEVNSRHGRYTDEELRYSAAARCQCGAGLAYHKRTSTRGTWECSALLTGRAKPGEEHTAPLPFAFYEVKSEDQPSANGRTTRPKE